MIAKLHLVLSITILFGGFYGWAQADLWQKGAISNKTVTVAEEGTSYKLATTTMNTLLAGVDSLETTSMYFPDSKGDMIVFKVRETAVFHPDLSKKFPQIKSYSGISEDGALKVRFSNSPLGLKAMLIDKLSGETHFLDKVSGTSNRYLLHRSNANASKTAFSCGTKDKPLAYGPMASRNLVTGRVKRKFRIAVSATGEYTQYYGGTIAEALAGINATLTRVNEVFETDLGVTLELIPNNDAVVFTNSSTDPYTNQLNTQLQSTLSAEIGEANYDVGHLFDTAPSEAENNGNAGFIGAVCVNNQKGSAFVSVFEPEGEVFDLDYVAHELGHQFGANHTWSFSGEGTGVQVEPGSGTTIMGYAGITQENDVAPNGDDYFHHNSIVQIQDYLDGVGCSQNTNLSNRPPTITLVQNNYHIPQGTAFALMANATDPDGDNLTYTWEQIDDGIVTTGTFGPNNVTGANFRSIPPSTAPIRYFPRLSRVIDGLLTQSNPVENDAWETVSEVARAFNFAVTVRDNNLEGGQVVSDTVTVDVESSAGPFRVTSQGTNEVYTAGSIQEITWDVANTNLAPIGTERVTLSLSTDGGVSFPITLADNVPNTGNTQVQLPGTATSAARVMVSAIDNVFFAVNSTDFTITEASAVLDFSSVNYEVCSSESLVVPFVYETYGGFSEQMDLSVNTTAPFTVSFSQTQVTAGDTDISLTLGNTQNVAVGTYEVEVTATGASFSTAVTLSIAVLSDNFSAVVPIFPEDEAQDITINPTFTWQSDPTVNSYDIEVSTDMNFNTIVAAATVVFPFFQSPELLPETVYYWRIKPRNTCGEGSFGPPLRFTTIAVQCKVFESASTPVVIPSVGTPTVEASLFVVEDKTITDVNVILEVTHTYLEDLVITLTSPSGTRITLLSRVCGESDDISAIFDDDGTAITCSSGPAVIGTVAPLGTLSSFNGESTSGEWRLEIEDTAPSDGGSIEVFDLEICVEGSFRPDDDNDGVFDDGDDLCLGTPEGIPVDTTGCPLNALPSDNFTVTVESGSCRGNNDGRIAVVAANTSIDYEGTLTSSGNTIGSIQFQEEGFFDELAIGTYELCITGSTGDITFRETCFVLIVSEPEALSVLASLTVNGEQVGLQLSGGGPYLVNLNGVITQTTASNIVLDLDPGANTLEVTTALPCQGAFEAQYMVGSSLVVSPNPVSEKLVVFQSFESTRLTISIFAADGKLVETYELEVVSSPMELDVSQLSSGVYYLRLTGSSESRTTKILKE